LAFTFTYNSLVSQVVNYSERTDAAFAETIDTFITLALDRITKECKTLGAELYVNNFFTINNPVLQKPTLWRTTITFNVGNGEVNNTRNQVLQRSYEFCRTYTKDDTVTGLPLYFCDYGYNNWLVCPTPDQAYPFEIAYLLEFGPLDITNQTNWLTQYAPQLLFYAVMLETMLYLKDDERSSIWEDRYNKALASVMKEDKDRITTRQSQRDKD
jgi:hypothetical protein